MILSKKLVLSVLAATLAPTGLATANDTDFYVLDGDYYKPSAADLADVHEKHQAYLKKTASIEPIAPPPALPKTLTLSNATAAQVDKARKLVDEANDQQGRYNLWRIANPRRDAENGKGTNARVSSGGRKRRSEEVANGAPAPPELTKELLSAIDVVYKVDTQEMYNNGTLQPYTNATADVGRRNVWRRDDGTTTWVDAQDHSLSRQPFHPDADYKVWRNVKDFGAVGDGVADDTAAIQKAIDSGRRCGEGCPESSISGAIVYFPPGTYSVKHSITLYYNTQVLGHGATLKSTRNFFGQGVFSTDVYLADGHSEWYLNTANFYRSVRGVGFDISNTRTKGMMALHWQVAQATTLEFISITMSNASDTTQIGVFAENGSGGWMSDLDISHGEYGILAGSQQYSASRITIFESKKCIGLIWNWVWSWSHMRLEGCDVAIDATAQGSVKESPPSSISLVDSSIIRSSTAFKTYSFDTSKGSQRGTTLISISKTEIYNVPTLVDAADGNSMKTINDGKWSVGHWQFGNAFDKGAARFGIYEQPQNRPEALLDQNGLFYSEGKPNFYAYTKDKVVNARTKAAGDGKTDDTGALQALLDYCAANSYILFIPAGTYVIKSPLLIPTNSRIQGEVWSQLMAVGDAFSDPSHPKAMVTVGQGETDGFVQMENLLFTSRGALPGLALLQWNLQSKKQGDVALRDCHFRVGGAVGTDLQKANCPKLTGSVDPKCIAAAMMLIKTDKGGGYFENMWAWVADHDLDDPKGDESNQISIYAGRGVLIYGDGPTWWRGTASEHSVLYQYNIAKAKNVYMSIIQTESPYYQGTAFAQAPAPFKVDSWVGEPQFKQCPANTTNCNAAWALIIQESSGVYIDGAGLYSWFRNYDQSDCVENSDCQQRLVNVYRSTNVFLSQIVTIGANEALTPGFSNKYNGIIKVKDTLAAAKYPWWTDVALYLDSFSDFDSSTNGGRFPVQSGFVAFGDSYGAGIGCGDPYEKTKTCFRNVGAYPSILNHLIAAIVPGGIKDFQFKACSGETAEDFIGGGATKQLEAWGPELSDVITVSFTGNDFYFGSIVSACLMGYRRGDDDANTECDKSLAAAEAKLERPDTVVDLVFDSLDAMIAKANHNGARSRRFLIYWTGYPRFFDTSTNKCDSAYFSALNIWKGRYLTQALRRQLNELSSLLNLEVRQAIDRWANANPDQEIVYIDPDNEDEGGLALYKDHRYCQPGVAEAQTDKTGQHNVAFFYPNGYDNVPSTGEGFQMPPPLGKIGPSSLNSATCDVKGIPNEPLVGMSCAIAKRIANNTLDASVASGPADPVTVKRESDGSVTITGLFDQPYMKMFHPTTRTNWRIAQAILQDMLRREYQN